MLSVVALSKRFRDRAVLDALQLDVAAGEYVAIVGESGSGKSTLLNLIAGLERPDAGHVRIDGIDVAALSDTDRTLTRRAKLGFVFQAFHILPHLTVLQNVELPLVLLGDDPERRSARAIELLAAVGLAGREASMPMELSGGELQRVAVARALVHRPALVLADEPTGNLDSVSSQQVMRLFRDLVDAHHQTVVLVTHDMNVAAHADRVLKVRDGRIEGEDWPRVPRMPPAPSIARGR